MIYNQIIKKQKDSDDKNKKIENNFSDLKPRMEISEITDEDKVKVIKAIQ